MGKTLLWGLCPLLVCGYRQAAVSEVQIENKLTPCRVVVRLETPPHPQVVEGVCVVGGPPAGISPGNDEEGIFTDKMQKHIYKPTESKELTERNFHF